MAATVIREPPIVGKSVREFCPLVPHGAEGCADFRISGGPNLHSRHSESCLMHSIRNVTPECVLDYTRKSENATLAARCQHRSAARVQMMTQDKESTSMKRNVLTVLTVIALLIVTAVASAQPPRRPGGPRRGPGGQILADGNRSGDHPRQPRKSAEIAGDSH